MCEYDYIAEYTKECTVAESMLQPSLRGNCDIDVDECASNPCQNGATCSESVIEESVAIHAYQCTCVAGFANGVCEYYGDVRPRGEQSFGFVAEYSAECTVMESEQHREYSALSTPVTPLALEAA